MRGGDKPSIFQRRATRALWVASGSREGIAPVTRERGEGPTGTAQLFALYLFSAYPTRSPEVWGQGRRRSCEGAGDAPDFRAHAKRCRLEGCARGLCKASR